MYPSKIVIEHGVCMRVYALGGNSPHVRDGRVHVFPGNMFVYCFRFSV